MATKGGEPFTLTCETAYAHAVCALGCLALCCIYGHVAILPRPFSTLAGKW